MAWSGLEKPPATAIFPSQNAPATSVRATGITGPEVVDRAGAGAGAGDDFESSLPPPLHAPSVTSASAITRVATRRAGTSSTVPVAMVRQ